MKKIMAQDGYGQPMDGAVTVEMQCECLIVPFEEQVKAMDDGELHYAMINTKASRDAVECLHRNHPGNFAFEQSVTDYNKQLVAMQTELSKRRVAQMGEPDYGYHAKRIIDRMGWADMTYSPTEPDVREVVQNYMVSDDEAQHMDFRKLVDAVFNWFEPEMPLFEGEPKRAQREEGLSEDDEDEKIHERYREWAEQESEILDQFDLEYQRRYKEDPDMYASRQAQAGIQVGDRIRITMHDSLYTGREGEATYDWGDGTFTVIFDDEGTGKSALIAEEQMEKVAMTKEALFMKLPELEGVAQPFLDMEIARLGMIAELDATNFYEKLSEMASDPQLKAALLDVAREEKTHTGEFDAILSRLDGEQLVENVEGAEEVGQIANEIGVGVNSEDVIRNASMDELADAVGLLENISGGKVI